MDIENIIDMKSHPLADQKFCSSCGENLNQTGVLAMRHFLNPKLPLTPTYGHSLHAMPQLYIRNRIQPELLHFSAFDALVTHRIGIAGRA